METKDIIYLSFFGAIVVFFVLRSSIVNLTSLLKERIDTQKRAIDAMERLASQMEVANQGNALIAGLTKVCEAHVGEYTKLRKAVEGFTVTILGKERRDAVEDYDEVDADRRFLRQQFMSQGMTEDEAIARADAEESKVMIGSVGY